MNDTPLARPALLLDEEICRTNIQRMARKAKEHDLQFKPHMKTHQSAEIGEWMKECGVKAITVSSVSMASYFARNGWEDITIAFPCNLLETESINSLASRVSLTLLVNSLTTARALKEHLSHPVDAYIELDTGSGRTGLLPSDIDGLTLLIDFFKGEDLLRWKGFYSHPGHSYNSRSQQDIQSVHQSVLKKVEVLRDKLGTTYGSFEICIGDTPCCSAGRDFTGIDAISPGNFVFFDLMQAQIRSCAVSDIATAVSCPVVDRYAGRSQLAIYGGAIHFSKESLTSAGIQYYGRIARREAHGWTIADQDSYLSRLSQEHGILQCSPSVFNRYSIGDTVTILPVHSCLTAHLLGRFHLINSGGKIKQFH